MGPRAEGPHWQRSFANLLKLKMLESWLPAIISKLSHLQSKHLLSLVFPFQRLCFYLNCGLFAFVTVIGFPVWGAGPLGAGSGTSNAALYSC